MRPISVALLVTICQNYHCAVTCACRPERNWDFRPENADLLKIDVHARPAPRARRPTPDKYNIGARSILLARGPMLRVLPTDREEVAPLTHLVEWGLGSHGARTRAQPSVGHSPPRAPRAPLSSASTRCTEEQAAVR